MTLQGTSGLYVARLWASRRAIAMSSSTSRSKGHAAGAGAVRIRRMRALRLMAPTRAFDDLPLWCSRTARGLVSQSFVHGQKSSTSTSCLTPAHWSATAAAPDPGWPSARRADRQARLPLRDTVQDTANPLRTARSCRGPTLDARRPCSPSRDELAQTGVESRVTLIRNRSPISRCSSFGGHAASITHSRLGSQHRARGSAACIARWPATLAPTRAFGDDPRRRMTAPTPLRGDLDARCATCHGARAAHWANCGEKPNASLRTSANEPFEALMHLAVRGPAGPRARPGAVR